jgi:hypothetical protein
MLQMLNPILPPTAKPLIPNGPPPCPRVDSYSIPTTNGWTSCQPSHIIFSAT